MKKKLCALALCALVLCGCGAGPTATSAPSSAPQSTQEPPASSAEPTALERAQERLATLTVEEKVGQMFFARRPETGSAEDAAAWHLGGYVLFGRDFQYSDGHWLSREDFLQNIQADQDAAKADTGIPLLIGSDEEGGTVTRASLNPNLFETPFLSPQALLSVGGMETLAADAGEKSQALLELGINVNLAPVCDVSTNAEDFMYDRTCGLAASDTSQAVAAQVEAMKSAGIGSVLKHFPGYGSNADTHTGAAVDQRPLEQFLLEDFLPFSAGMEAGGATTAVLVSHNTMTAVDDQLPASLSPAVHELLREELNFDGVAITDDLAMEAVSDDRFSTPAAVLAVLAGNDLLISSDYATQIPQVLSAVKDGTIPMERIDEAVTRVLLWKEALGLL